ncbi:MAG: ABC transporter permease [Anaerolineae bacterium]|nr:ABC transporter permease [Anaerolineae bacterium]
MNLSEGFRIALNSLIINRLRAILTTLGIVIGVGAVVGLTSLGRGVQDYVASQFADLGANTLTVTSSAPSSHTRTQVQALTDQEAAAIAKLTGVKQVSPTYGVPGTVVYGTETATLSLNGVMPAYAEVSNWFPRSDGGRFISQADVDDTARVVVLGESTVKDLFGDKTHNPIGLSVQINGRVFTVIGVMDNRSGASPADLNAAAIIPISTAQTRLADARVRGGAYKVSQIQVMAESQEEISLVRQEISTYLTEAHGIVYAGDEDFSVSSQADLLNSISAITGLLTVFLGGVAGISLLVGGIGIMNIMLVSVTERTREIGLRKAVGAQAGDILSQFLMESIILSLLGGLLGITMGWLITVIGGAIVPDLHLGLTLDSVMLATGVSSFVGIFFGLYPASRAARMRPIDALRFE